MSKLRRSPKPKFKVGDVVGVYAKHPFMGHYEISGGGPVLKMQDWDPQRGWLYTVQLWGTPTPDIEERNMKK